MRSHTMKLAVAGLAAATALSLSACDPNDPNGTGGASAGSTGGAAGGRGAPSTSGGATGGAAGGAAGSAAGTASGGAASGGASGGAANGGPGGLPHAATTVKYGQPVTVDFADKFAKVSTKLQITVTGVEVGSIQDLTSAGLNTAGLTGRTPMYVSYTMKNVGDASLSFTAPDSEFVVFDSTGHSSEPVLSADKPLPKCTGASFHGFSKGTEVKGCTIISTTGKTPAMVGYTEMVDLLKLQAAWTK
ncbi:MULTISPECIES: hypothetical protein [Kitasatospora]|uniref:DUF4352 domain-containing protein n=1 Tax=Kitasatospora cystarginea TaxID=58350 RepID=A0ABN3EH76_9ACTN